MFELLGIVFGGAARLTQHWMETKDKQNERDHEARMFDKQVQLQQMKSQADLAQQQLVSDTARDSGELSLLSDAIKDQSAEAMAAGGLVAKLSASVRPVVSYWLLAIYTVSKASSFWLEIERSGTLDVNNFAKAFEACYTQFDGALLGSIVSFWFADRSLRKAGK
jgi:hypothetical protein